MSTAPHVTFDVPQGGFYLWLELGDDVDWERRGGRRGGVLCRPGEVFMGKEDGARFLRLAYSHVSEDELRRGIAALGKAINSAVEGVTRRCAGRLEHDVTPSGCQLELHDLARGVGGRSR